MISAYCILHYGVEWLRWSIRSVIDQVDEFHIFYTPIPSHGFATNYPNPETREQLYAEVMDFDERLYWHDCPDRFEHEGYHREFAVKTCVDRGADTIVVVDADEIWAPGVLKVALEMSTRPDVHSFRINMMHFWRSLKWVCYDSSGPTRIIKPHVHDMSEGFLSGRVYHMGYAQTPEIIFYKMQIHGHFSEWRRDWYDKIFLPWHPGMRDVHPTSIDFWTPVRFEDNGTLEKLVGDHPYWGKDIIGE